MSYVTYPVILLIGFSCCDLDKVIAAFKSSCIRLENGHEENFNEHSVKEHGGNKGGAVYIFSGGHNYFSEEDSIEICKDVLKHEKEVTICKCIYWTNESVLMDAACDRWDNV